MDAEKVFTRPSIFGDMFLGTSDRFGTSALSALVGSSLGLGGTTQMTGELAHGEVQNASHDAALGNSAFAFC